MLYFSKYLLPEFIFFLVLYDSAFGGWWSCWSLAVDPEVWRACLASRGVFLCLLKGVVSTEKNWDSFAWNICLFYPIIYLFNNLYHDGYLFYPCVLSCFSNVHLFATLWTVASGSSIHGILQMRILEWVTMAFSRGSCWSRNRNCVFCRLHCRWILYH